MFGPFSILLNSCCHDGRNENFHLCSLAIYNFIIIILNYISNGYLNDNKWNSPNNSSIDVWWLTYFEVLQGIKIQACKRFSCVFHVFKVSRHPAVVTETGKLKTIFASARMSRREVCIHYIQNVIMSTSTISSAIKAFKKFISTFASTNVKNWHLIHRLCKCACNSSNIFVHSRWPYWCAKYNTMKLKKKNFHSLILEKIVTE